MSSFLQSHRAFVQGSDIKQHGFCVIRTHASSNSVSVASLHEGLPSSARPEHVCPSRSASRLRAYLIIRIASSWWHSQIRRGCRLIRDGRSAIYLCCCRDAWKAYKTSASSRFVERWTFRTLRNRSCLTFNCHLRTTASQVDRIAAWAAARWSDPLSSHGRWMGEKHAREDGAYSRRLVRAYESFKVLQSRIRMSLLVITTHSFIG